MSYNMKRENILHLQTYQWVDKSKHHA